MPKKAINVINTATGEVLSFPASSDLEIAQSYDMISQQIKAFERAKEQLKFEMLDRMTDDQLEVDGQYFWRRDTRRYLNYNTPTLKRLVDEDTFADMVVPKKTLIDHIIKETVAGKSTVLSLEAAEELRENMIEERPPVVALRLERLKK